MSSGSYHDDDVDDDDVVDGGDGCDGLVVPALESVVAICMDAAARLQ